MAAEAKVLDQFSDWRWRLNNLYWIVTEAGQRIPFRLNDAQERLFDGMHYLNVILKARQLGFSTFIQIFMLDACLFNSDTHAGTIAHTRDDAEELFRNKTRFAYDNLPDGLKQARPATEDSARKLTFSNDSSIVVGTSLRSGTYQYLHVSEYGKLCAKFPEKAREVRTGALNTVHAGQVIFIESTAEGQDGHFFELCEQAQSLSRTGAGLTLLDFKFFFYPWWQHPGYVLAPAGVVLTQADDAYFEKLERDGIVLTDEQKAWYVKKALTQGADMKREFPSTPKEAFEASIEGAWYAEAMAKVEVDGRIGPLPIEHVATETWWDLGLNDLMSILWVQRVGPWMHFIDYYENSGEGLKHYASILQEKQREHDLVYGDHLWPHDGGSRIMDETGRTRQEVMAGLGFQVRVIERGKSVNTGIEATRQLLDKARFHEKRCAPLIKALKNYRKEWDDARGVYKNRPLHNWASHAADAVRTGSMYRPFEEDWSIEWADDFMDDGRSAATGY